MYVIHRVPQWCMPSLQKAGCSPLQSQERISWQLLWVRTPLLLPHSLCRQGWEGSGKPLADSERILRDFMLVCIGPGTPQELMTIRRCCQASAGTPGTPLLHPWVSSGLCSQRRAAAALTHTLNLLSVPQTSSSEAWSPFCMIRLRTSTRGTALVREENPCYICDESQVNPSVETMM